jgi:hypothetical protein
MTPAHIFYCKDWVRIFCMFAFYGIMLFTSYYVVFSFYCTMYVLCMCCLRICMCGLRFIVSYYCLGLFYLFILFSVLG